MIYLSKRLDKACFHGDMAYGDFEDLTRRTTSDKILRDKAFNIAKNPNHDGYHHRIATMVYKLFNRKDSATCARPETLATRNKFVGCGIKNENISGKWLSEKLHKSIIRKFKKRKVHSPFIDSIWVVELADMQLIIKFDKRTLILLCAIDIFSKYAWVIPLKDKKGIAINNAFQKLLKESNQKPNKMWVDKDSEFYNKSMKSWLEKSDIEMYSTNNDGKSVVAERFIRTLKTH